MSLDESDGHYSTTNGQSEFSHPQYDLETTLHTSNVEANVLDMEASTAEKMESDGLFDLKP